MNLQKSRHCTIERIFLRLKIGAARHANMLETDQAWDVFGKLEDCYFSQNPSTIAQEPITEGDGRTVVIRFVDCFNCGTLRKAASRGK